MKFKFMLPLLMLGATLVASADGYKDGIEYYKAGQYDNAREILERNLNAPSTDKALAYYYLGQTALAQGNKAEAKSYFDKGVAANSECAYNYVGLGAIDLLNGQEKAAEDNFKKAQNFGKKNHEITVDIARAYYKADPVKYAKEVDKFLAKAHKDSKHQEPAIYILEGDMQFDARDLGGAAAKYEQAITFDVNNPEGYVKYANAYMGVNPIYGVNKLEELVAKLPNSALAQRELAEKYFENQQWTKAAQQYGQYLQNPNHFVQDKPRYSVLLFANEDYNNSLRVAREVVAQDPTDFQSNRMIMLNLSKMGDDEGVLQAAEKFFALPEVGNAKFTAGDFIAYGTALENLGKNDEAIVAYQKAIEINPSGDNYKALSNAYTKMNELVKSAETFDQYISSSENASLTDYLQSSIRWLKAAAKAEDEETMKAAADKGLVAINHVLENASTIDPSFYRFAGQLSFYKNGKNVDKDTFDAYSNLVGLIEPDPANADPANPNNKLDLLSEAYLFLGMYYQGLGDDANKDAMFAKSDAYKALKEGAAQ